MSSGPATAERTEAPLFSDGVGERVVAVDAATGDLLQILRVRPQLLAVPSFEFALRERAARLANFRHAYYARVRRIDRHPTGLAIVSDHVEGVRLSDMLRVAQARGLQLDLNAALCLLRQLVPSIALLHENARDVAHGLVGPERLVITPRARLVVVEHVLGSAVEQLQFNRERLWQELRVGVPMSVGAVRFDHRADVTGIGLTALALVLGRPIDDHEYPHRVAALLHDARARGAAGEEQPLPDALHAWIARLLTTDVRQSFANATEAQAGLEDALAEDSGFVAAPVALETFLSRYITALLEPAIPAPVPPPAATRSVPPVSAVPPVSPVPPVSSVAPVAAVPLVPPVAPVAPVPPEAGRYRHEEEKPVPPAPAAAPVVVAAEPVRAEPVRAEPVRAEPVKAEPVKAEPVKAEPVREEFVAAPPAYVEPPAPPQAPPRDITELLKDFDLPPAAPAPVYARTPVEDVATPADAGGGRSRRTMMIAAAVVALLAVGGGVVAMRASRKPAPPALGTLSVQTNPPGVPVFVDGEAHGNTPARISLNAGSHILEIRGRGVPRVIPVTITAGTEASQYLEIPQTPVTGSLLVQSDPAGALVSVDGVEHGAAPATIADLAPGEHEVVLQGSGGAPVKQKVVIQAGVTASVLAPVSTATPGPVSGWLTVKAPVTIEVREGGRLIGTTDADRIMMASGRHDVELVNDTLGYHMTRSIQVPPGKVLPITLELPPGMLNVNASPWAEVWIDGRRVGETPIGNLPLSIGAHEVVFRHPQLGEKRQAVSVTLRAPVRLSMDMK